jgi:hypothetical protein
MTNFEIQTEITQNLLLGLKAQSEAYLLLIQDSQYTHDQRKDFEKELSDINKVLTELSSKTLSYTVQELEQLKNTFNDKLIELNNIVTDLDLNTLNIEFNSLTPQQKTFLKGEKGDRGLSSYEVAKVLGFVGNEVQWIDSLRGETGLQGEQGIQGLTGETGLQGEQGIQGLRGETGLQGIQGIQGLRGESGLQGEQGIQGLKGLDGSVTFESLTPEQIEMLKGETGLQGEQGIHGLNGLDGAVTFESLTPEQIEMLKGETGLQGEQGIQGLTGEAGLQGEQGIQGLNGLDGSVTFESLTPEQIEILKGETGLQGEQGIQGLRGETGLQGEQGIQGLRGETGQDGVLDFNSLTAEQKEEIASFVPSSSDLLTSVFFLNDTTKAYTYIKTSIKFDSCFYLIILNYSFSSVVQTKYKQVFFSVVDSVFYPTVGGDVNYSPFINNDGFLCIKCNNIGKTMVRIECKEKPFKISEVVYYDYDTHPNYVPKTNITSYFP